VLILSPILPTSVNAVWGIPIPIWRKLQWLADAGYGGFWPACGLPSFLMLALWTRAHPLLLWSGCAKIQKNEGAWLFSGTSQATGARSAEQYSTAPAPRCPR